MRDEDELAQTTFALLSPPCRLVLIVIPLHPFNPAASLAPSYPIAFHQFLSPSRCQYPAPGLGILSRWVPGPAKMDCNSLLVFSFGLSGGTGPPARQPRYRPADFDSRR